MIALNQVWRTIPGASVTRIRPRWLRQQCLCMSKATPDATPEKSPVSIFQTAPCEEAGVQSSPSVKEVPTEGIASIEKGEVMGVREDVVTIEGLSPEVPIGTELCFQNGQIGVLLWRHTGEVSFALLLEGIELNVHDSVEPCLTDDGLVRQYTLFEVGTGAHLKGDVFEFVRVHRGGGGGNLMSTEKKPLLNKQLDMASRQCIYQPLPMQHKGIDVLTPIGRGQCILLVSENGRETTDLAQHMIMAQMVDASVSSIYVCLGKSENETARIESRFRENRLLERCFFLKATDDSSLAQRFSVLCTALSIGEQIRDDGGDALVVIDTLEPLTEIWNLMQSSYAEQKRQANHSKEEEDDDALVEVDGTFMAAETAERRRFFSSVLQRAAKASDDLGGGSLTMIPVVIGSPANGHQRQELQSRLDTIDKDPKLSETLKAKLRSKLTSLTKKDSDNTSDASAAPTFIVEEFMSITDGQIVIKELGDRGIYIDPLLSVSRIGARAYPPALESLAPNIRLQLAQAADAVQFGSASENETSQAWNVKIDGLKEALVQQSRQLFPLSHQVVLLMALQTEKAQGHTKQELQHFLSETIAFFDNHHANLITEIDATQSLSPELQMRILRLLKRL